jgi:hypothetical protein
MEEGFCMIAEGKNASGAARIDAQLSMLIRREMDSMMAGKERYDLDFPAHAKQLTRPEIRQMARKRVMHDLCLPDFGPEDTRL